MAMARHPPVLRRLALLVALAASAGCDRHGAERAGPVRSGDTTGAGAAHSAAPASAPAAGEPTPASTADMMKLTHDPDAKLILLNVWATWCAPCREELPALVRIQHENASRHVKILLLSADADTPPAKVAAYLGTVGVDFPTYIKTDSGPDLIKGITSDWSGAIPATFVYSGDGTMIDFWEGKATYEAFRDKLDEELSAGAQPPAPTPG